MLVQVQEGKLRGIEKKNKLTDQPYCAFSGIPYAKPPVGDLRFRPPVPIEEWNGVYDASKEGNECLQQHFNVRWLVVKVLQYFQYRRTSSSTFSAFRLLEMTGILYILQLLAKLILMLLGEGPTITGSEDCLFLNIYTPEAPSRITDKKAVMIYFHGGGFIFGSGSAYQYGPDYLMDQDVICVTVNYRLHIFGFLNVGTESCPGNVGLKDQLLAMKWVKKNINSFGGDSENITIFGASSGAVSVHLHMLSPLSKGSFNRTIAQGGTCFSPWATEENPEYHARYCAKLAGYKGHDLEGLVRYLRSVSADKLCEIALQCHEELKENNPGGCTTVCFLPSVEKIKDGAFLPDSPSNLMMSAPRIPSIFGFNSLEGLLMYLVQSPKAMGMLIDDLSNAVKNNFNLDECERIILLAKIKKLYFDGEPITPESKPRIVNLIGDLYYLKFYEAIDYMIKSDCPPYIYLFAYDGRLNWIQNIVKYFDDIQVEGAAHSDEIGYLFTQTIRPIKPTKTDEKVIKQLCTLWTNFAKTGNPVSSVLQIDWKPHTSSNPCYIKIDEKMTVYNGKIFEARFNFWKTWSDRFV